MHKYFKINNSSRRKVKTLPLFSVKTVPHCRKDLINRSDDVPRMIPDLPELHILICITELFLSFRQNWELR